MDVDEISLHWLVAVAQGFALPQAGRDDILRRCILALLAAGAHPSAPVGGAAVAHSALWRNGSPGVVWKRLDYGDTPEMIAEAIVEEWRRNGSDPLDFSVWFARNVSHDRKLGT
ncbi:hypothetical protein [Reyranella sp.]|uniref:hypothetical protein n=1 Tax=Reyranella sp. TaxID=1929291 RepID=UPI003D0F03F7